MSIIHCEQERNIAIELEQKMMEDFEWKLREVEGGYKTKIKSLEEGLESKVSEGNVFSWCSTLIYTDPSQHAGDHARERRGVDEDVHRRAQRHGGEAEEGAGQSEGFS